MEIQQFIIVLLGIDGRKVRMEGRIMKSVYNNFLDSINITLTEDQVIQLKEIQHLCHLVDFAKGKYEITQTNLTKAKEEAKEASTELYLAQSKLTELNKKYFKEI